MLAPEERERLLGAIVGVYATAEPERVEGPPRASASAAFAGLLSAEEEELVMAVREALERIAAAVAVAAVPESVTLAALGGAELTARGEIMAGHPERLPLLLPDFAYLVTLPHLGEPEAARRLRQVRALVEGAPRSAGDE